MLLTKTTRLVHAFLGRGLGHGSWAHQVYRLDTLAVR